MTRTLDVSFLSQALADAGIVLPVGGLERLDRHAAELLRWNRAIRLTAIVDPLEIAVKHVLDSLLLLKLGPFPGRTLDAGSGGGYPGIPLAVACPGSRIVLLDSIAKKCSFLSHVCRQLELPNVEVVRGRIAKGPALPIGRFDQVVSRAAFPPAGALSLLAPYLLPGGRLLLMTGPEGRPGEPPAPLRPGRRMRFALPRELGERQILEYRAV